MRDYAKVSPQFWTGKTGKALKAAGPEAVIVGMYLMTSPHSTMLGLYHCPLVYIAHDTGLGLEGASKGLASAIEAGFCTFEADTDYVFVHEFAAYQIGDELEAKDNRVKGVLNELSKVPKGQCWREFIVRYGAAFKLEIKDENGSPFKAPSKPGAGAGDRAGAGKRPPSPRKRGDGFDPTAIELPEWLDPVLWAKWCKDRRDRKKPITEEGARAQIRRLDAFRQAGQTPQQVLDHAMAAGHQGLYPPVPSKAPAPRETSFEAMR